jgi:hypothetical protein
VGIAEARTNFLDAGSTERTPECKTSVICSYFDQKYSSDAICPELIVIG